MLVASGCCSLLGLLVWLGWYGSSAVLLQVTRLLSPMLPNTALSFWLCGVGLLAMVFGWRYLTAVSAVVVAAIGLLMLTQHMFIVDWGIEQFFMVIETTKPPGYHGRIVLTTALCCTISGLALVVVSRPTSYRYRPMLLGTCASLVTALTLAVLVGYTAGIVDIQRWGESTQMVVYTAIGFLSIGAGILACAWDADRAETPGAATLLPVLVCMGVLRATLCSWQALETQERASIK